MKITQQGSTLLKDILIEETINAYWIFDWTGIKGNIL